MTTRHESMKLIKAFVRTDRLDEVVQALEQAGAPGITVSSVHGVGYGYEPFLFTLAPGEVKKTPRVAKVEVVCGEANVDGLCDVIMRCARTGQAGDGILFVTPVERAMRIRTGEGGVECL